MGKTWYLFKEVSYYIENEEFVECKTAFYLYNSKYRNVFYHSTEIDKALRSKVIPYKDQIFLLPIIKYQVPLFSSCSCDDYCYEARSINRVLPKIKVGETFVKEAISYTYNLTSGRYLECYKDYSNPLKKYVSSLHKYKEYIKNKEYSIDLTEEEVKCFKLNNDRFSSITLLHVSKDKPVIEDIEKNYPELLV